MRRLDSRDLRFAVVVLAGILVNPHLYVYDLVVLVVPLAVITGWLLEESAASSINRAAAVGVRVLYWLPLVAPILGLLRVQLTAPTTVWLLWALGSDVRARSTGRRGNV